MACCSLVSSDLANMHSHIFFGCAYSKAYRKQWRHKVIRNINTLHQSTLAGQVVSVYQISSPTLGGGVTHRGLPTKKRYISATICVDHFQTTCMSISWQRWMKRQQHMQKRLSSAYYSPIRYTSNTTMQAMVCLIPSSSILWYKQQDVPSILRY